MFAVLRITIERFTDVGRLAKEDLCRKILGILRCFLILALGGFPFFDVTKFIRYYVLMAVTDQWEYC